MRPRALYERLLESAVLEEGQKQRLQRTFRMPNPVKLKAAQTPFAAHATGRQAGGWIWRPHLPAASD